MWISNCSQQGGTAVAAARRQQHSEWKATHKVNAFAAHKPTVAAGKEAHAAWKATCLPAKPHPPAAKPPSPASPEGEEYIPYLLGAARASPLLTSPKGEGTKSHRTAIANAPRCNRQRTALQSPTHRTASANAPRCISQRTALQSPTHRTASANAPRCISQRTALHLPTHRAASANAPHCIFHGCDIMETRNWTEAHKGLSPGHRAGSKKRHNEAPCREKSVPLTATLLPPTGCSLFCFPMP